MFKSKECVSEWERERRIRAHCPVNTCCVRRPFMFASIYKMKMVSLSLTPLRLLAAAFDLDGIKVLKIYMYILGWRCSFVYTCKEYGRSVYNVLGIQTAIKLLLVAELVYILYSHLIVVIIHAWNNWGEQLCAKLGGIVCGWYIMCLIVNVIVFGIWRSKGYGILIVKYNLYTFYLDLINFS